MNDKPALWKDIAALLLLGVMAYWIVLVIAAS